MYIYIFIFIQYLITEIFHGDKNEVGVLKSIGSLMFSWIKTRISLDDLLDINADLVDLQNECHQIYTNKVMRQCIQEYTLGYITPHNTAIEDVIFEKYQTDLSQDAAFSGIPNKFGRNFDENSQRKQKLHASELNTANEFNYRIMSTRLCPKGGEPYIIWMDEIAEAVVRNMTQSKYYPGGWEKFKFQNRFNLDRGTSVNPDNIRNVIVFLIKKKLGLHPDAKFYHNSETNVTYNFKEYVIEVSQELFHLYIRARQARLFHYHHSDWKAVNSAFHDVHACYKSGIFNPQTMADVIDNVSTFHPYQAYNHQQLSMLRNQDTLENIKNVIIAYCRLQNTKDLKLRGELLSIIHGQNILTTPYPDECTDKKIVADILLWCLKRLTKRGRLRFMSVKFESN